MHRIFLPFTVVFFSSKAEANESRLHLDLQLTDHTESSLHSPSKKNLSEEIKNSELTSCLSEVEFRSRLEARLEKSLSFLASKVQLLVTLSKEPSGSYLSKYKIIRDKGLHADERELRTSTSCSDLSQATLLSMQIALNYLEETLLEEERLKALYAPLSHHAFLGLNLSPGALPKWSPASKGGFRFAPVAQTPILLEASVTYMPRQEVYLGEGLSLGFVRGEIGFCYEPFRSSSAGFLYSLPHTVHVLPCAQIGLQSIFAAHDKPAMQKGGVSGSGRLSTNVLWEFTPQWLLGGECAAQFFTHESSFVSESMTARGFRFTPAHLSFGLFFGRTL